MRVFGKALKIKRLILISLTGILLGALGYLEIYAIFWLVFLGFCLLLGLVSFLLYFKTIIYFGEYSLEVSASGDIFITKLSGHCTLCLGNLKVIKNKKGTFLQCREDKNHCWDVSQKV